MIKNNISIELLVKLRNSLRKKMISNCKLEYIDLYMTYIRKIHDLEELTNQDKKES